MQLARLPREADEAHHDPQQAGNLRDPEQAQRRDKDRADVGGDAEERGEDERKPHASQRRQRIAHLAPVPRDHRGSGKPERQALEDRLNEGIRRLPDLFPRTYVLDIARYAPPFDEDVFVRSYQLGGHLNPMGYLLFARMIGSYIDYIIRHNMNDFKQVGFIGTPWRNTKDTGAYLPDEK